MLKVVIDTNLLVASMFNKRSASFQIIDLARKNKIVLLWSEAIEREANFILKNISHSSKRKRINLEEIFKKENKVNNPPKVKAVQADPEDDKFLACALAGEADVIISNDKHLLELQKFKGIPVLNTREGIAEIKNGS